MLKQVGVCYVLCIVALAGCAMSSRVDPPPRVQNIHIGSQDSIIPIELYATVGEEIRWHNQLLDPIYLGFLGVNPIKEVGCGKGFKTWYGGIKDLVMIRAGAYVSVCFTRAGTVRYNVWTDLRDPQRSISPTAVIYLESST